MQGEIRSVSLDEFVVLKYHGKRQSGRLIHMSVHNIKTDNKDIEQGLDCSVSSHSLMAGSCEHDDETPYSIKAGNFLIS
jgi:hypothetical protein